MYSIEGNDRTWRGKNSVGIGAGNGPTRPLCGPCHGPESRATELISGRPLEWSRGSENIEVDSTCRCMSRPNVEELAGIKRIRSDVLVSDWLWQHSV